MNFEQDGAEQPLTRRLSFNVRSRRMPDKMIRYGDDDVALLERHWPRRESMTPYFRTDLLKIGDNWRDAPIKGNYTEHYVELEDGPVPVGVMIARELRDDGASISVCTDLTLGELRLLDPDLICVAPSPELKELLDALHAANGGAGLGYLMPSQCSQMVVWYFVRQRLPRRTG